MILKALREGEYQALLVQVRLKDSARVAKPGVWLAAALPADVEFQLVVPITVYYWLQAFHDLLWRGKPDRQMGATHWQEWLQAHAQGNAVDGLGPAPATRALDTPDPGRARAAHGSAGQPTLRPSARGRHPQVGGAPCGKGGQRTDEMPPMRRQVLHKRGDAGTPGVARGALCRPNRRQGGGLPYPPGTGKEVPVARPVRPAPPPPPGAGHVVAPGGEEEAANAAPGAGGAAHHRSIPARLAPLWAPLGAGPPHHMAMAHPGDLAPPADPAVTPIGHS